MAKKNVSIRVVESCTGSFFWAALFAGDKEVFTTPFLYEGKSSAKRRAKRIAEQTGITYDPEIIKQHGC